MATIFECLPAPATPPTARKDIQRASPAKQRRLRATGLKHRLWTRTRWQFLAEEEDKEEGSKPKRARPAKQDEVMDAAEQEEGELIPMGRAEAMVERASELVAQKTAEATAQQFQKRIQEMAMDNARLKEENERLGHQAASRGAAVSGDEEGKALRRTAEYSQRICDELKEENRQLREQGSPAAKPEWYQEDLEQEIERLRELLEVRQGVRERRIRKLANLVDELRCNAVLAAEGRKTAVEAAEVAEAVIEAAAAEDDWRPCANKLEADVFAKVFGRVALLLGARTQMQSQPRQGPVGRPHDEPHAGKAVRGQRVQGENRRDENDQRKEKLYRDLTAAGWLDMERLQAKCRMGTCSYKTAMKTITKKLRDPKTTLEEHEELEAAKEELQSCLRGI